MEICLGQAVQNTVHQAGANLRSAANRAWWQRKKSASNGGLLVTDEAQCDDNRKLKDEAENGPSLSSRGVGGGTDTSFARRLNDQVRTLPATPSHWAYGTMGVGAGAVKTGSAFCISSQLPFHAIYMDDYYPGVIPSHFDSRP